MSSWSLLLALSGWEYDGPRQSLRFAPRHTPEKLKIFFAGPEGWGNVRQSRQETEQTNEICVSEGQLRLAKLSLAPATPPGTVKVVCAGKSIAVSPSFEAGVLRISFRKPLLVKTGQTLAVRISSRKGR